MTDTQTVLMNREGWLTAFSEKVAPLIKQRTRLSIDGFKVSCGFPARGGLARKSRRIGECWVIPDHKHREIFIHPQLAKAEDVAETLLHELLHAALPPGTGHRKPFSQAAKKLGLEGKPTSTVLGDDLREAIKPILAELGDYPHDALPINTGPKQSTRLLKAKCPVCGYIIRTTAKWLDEAGAPVCPQCDVQMLEGPELDEEGEIDPLVAVEQNTIYNVKPTVEVVKAAIDAQQARGIAKPRAPKFDTRWALSMRRQGRVINWYVIDYGEPTVGDEIEMTDPKTGEPIKVRPAVLGVVTPRLTPAESRQDAIDLLYRLREDPETVYREVVEVDDTADLDAEWFDNTPDEPGDFPVPPEHLDDEDLEDPDYPEDNNLELFPWEKARGIDPESIDPLAEQAKRESWVKTEE